MDGGGVSGRCCQGLNSWGLLSRVLLESFISTQKLSVQKTLQRKFKRFVAHAGDFQELLLSVLQGLVREQLRYEAMNGAAPGADTFVSVPIGCDPISCAAIAFIFEPIGSAAPTHTAFVCHCLCSTTTA